jgi:hypothetical protein
MSGMNGAEELVWTGDLNDFLTMFENELREEEALKVEKVTFPMLKLGSKRILTQKDHDSLRQAVDDYIKSVEKNFPCPREDKIATLVRSLIEKAEKDFKKKTKSFRGDDKMKFLSTPTFEVNNSIVKIRQQHCISKRFVNIYINYNDLVSIVKKLKK